MNCSTVVTAIVGHVSAGDVSVGIQCAIKYREVVLGGGAKEWHYEHNPTCSSQVITNLVPGMQYELVLTVSYRGATESTTCQPPAMFRSKHCCQIFRICLFAVNIW